MTNISHILNEFYKEGIPFSYSLIHYLDIRDFYRKNNPEKKGSEEEFDYIIHMLKTTKNTLMDQYKQTLEQAKTFKHLSNNSK